MKSNLMNLTEKVDNILTKVNSTEAMDKKLDDLQSKIESMEKLITKQNEILSNMNGTQSSTFEDLKSFTNNLDCYTSREDNVKCSITVHTSLNSVSYNENTLKITGNVNRYRVEKSFTFKSCDEKNPGKLVINGTQTTGNDNFCYHGGLMVHCVVSKDSKNPWHNFKSDYENWKVNGEASMCSEGEGRFSKEARNIHPISKFFEKGAKDIWADSKSVSFIGSPKPKAKTSEDSEKNDKETDKMEKE